MSMIETDRDLTGLTLDELSELAATENAATLSSLSAALDHSIRCGEVLLEARKRCERGEWQAWLRAAGIWEARANGMMRLAHHRDAIPSEAFETWTDKNGTLRNPSTTRAISFVKGLGLPPVPGLWEPPSAETKSEVLRLRQTGLSFEQISQMVGVSTTTAWKWCEPAKDRQAKQRKANQRKRERRALERLAKSEAQTKTAKTVGGELSKSYGLVRQALAALDKVGGELAGNAIRDLHRAEESIVKAMREERAA